MRKKLFFPTHPLRRAAAGSKAIIGRLAEFKAYPGLVRAYLRAAWKFMSSIEEKDEIIILIE